MNEKQTNKGVTVTLPAESITQEETGETLSIMTADQVADREVKKFDLAKAWIASRKEQYSILKIHGLDDKDGYKKVEEAWREIRNKRLAVANKHKELKADYLVITRKIDGAKNEFTELLEEIEKPLKQKLDEIEDLKKEEELKAERERQQKLQDRVSELLENGMKFDGSFYSIGDTVSMDIVTLREMNDADFAKLSKLVFDKNTEILEATRKENEAKQKEREEFEQKQKEQAQKEKELQAERDAISKERLEARTEFLLTKGFVYNSALDIWEYKYGSASQRVKLHNLGEYSSDTWSQMVKELGEIITEVNVQAKAEDEKAEALKLEAAQKEKENLAQIAKDNEIKHRLELRVKDLLSFGFVKGIDGYYVLAGANTSEKIDFSVDAINAFSDLEFASELERAFHLKNQIIIDDTFAKDEADKKAETLRQEKLSEVEKVLELIEKLKVVYIGFKPVVTNPSLSKVIANLQDAIHNAENITKSI